VETAVAALRKGAADYLQKPFAVEDLTRRITQVTRDRRARRDVSSDPSSPRHVAEGLVGQSEAIQAVRHQIVRCAAAPTNVLITGESGVGKELAARAIHAASPRGEGAFVPVNCGAIPETLLESQLFGHVKGAFTGAVRTNAGLFTVAHEGTLFLDEIGELPFPLQVKLLRVLEDRQVWPVGATRPVPVDVRIIASTNRDLIAETTAGRFREDLFYRLNVVPIHVPPLRERLGDIPLLVQYFIEKVCRQEDLPPQHIAHETMDRLCHYLWPGNVRQLENAVEMAIVLAGDRSDLYPGDFPLPPAALRPAVSSPSTTFHMPDDGLDFERTVNRIERSILEQALQKTSGNKKQAAEMLRLKRTTLAAKLKSLEMAGA
jgi:DNA-binding NtrC family response regulator